MGATVTLTISPRGSIKYSDSDFKGAVRPKITNTYFPPTCSVVYPSRLFWCELQSVDCRDVCLLSNIMGLNDIKYN